MYEAELYSIVKTDGNCGINYKAYVLVNYHGIEEEVEFRFENLKDIPRYLIFIKNGKVKVRAGLQVMVSHPHEDANGLTMGYIYENKEAA